MTIYSTIICQEFINRINDITKKTENADYSVSNIALSFFKLGRNWELSKEKREILSNLKKNFETLEDSQDDQSTSEYIRTVLADCLRQLSEKTTDKNFDSGQSEKTINTLSSIESDIYNKLDEKKLLNIADNLNPLNRFLYHAASYFALNVVRKQYPALCNNPYISDNNLVMKNKENLLEDRMNICENFLNVMKQGESHENYKNMVFETLMLYGKYAQRNTNENLEQKMQKEHDVLNVLRNGESDEHYSEVLKEVILLNIDQLQHDNHMLCQQHGKSDGSLNDLLNKAIQEITLGQKIDNEIKSPQQNQLDTLAPPVNETDEIESIDEKETPDEPLANSGASSVTHSQTM